MFNDLDKFSVDFDNQLAQNRVFIKKTIFLVTFSCKKYKIRNNIIFQNNQQLFFFFSWLATEILLTFTTNERSSEHVGT